MLDRKQTSYEHIYGLSVFLLFAINYQNCHQDLSLTDNVTLV